jgi:hypothetical protein
VDAENYLHAPCAYRVLMEIHLREVRDFTVRGHVIRVFPSDQNLWGVIVDGMEFGPRFSNNYSAWAAGVAESYRREPGAEPRTLAALGSRAAARQRRPPRHRVSPAAVSAP